MDIAILAIIFLTGLAVFTYVKYIKKKKEGYKLKYPNSKRKRISLLIGATMNFSGILLIQSKIVSQEFANIIMLCGLIIIFISIPASWEKIEEDKSSNQNISEEP
mgnify:CR=1 FL=1